MIGILAPVQVSRSAYRAVGGSIHHAAQCLICSSLDSRCDNRMTDHVPTRHADKSADFLDANSAAIIRSQRFLETSADNFSHPSRSDSPFRGGFFLRTTLPVQLSESEQY
jgi:hypothetical protein